MWKKLWNYYLGIWFSKIPEIVTDNNQGWYFIVLKIA